MANPADGEARIVALRGEMDEADRALLLALAARRAVSRKMAEVKRAEGLPFRDEAREAELLRRVAGEGAELGLPAGLIAELYPILLRDSLEIQESAGKAT